MAAHWPRVAAPSARPRAFHRSVSLVTASLPSPTLHGSAATNPRSVFNPLVLAYLGDAVWEAHTRRLEIEVEARGAGSHHKQNHEQQLWRGEGHRLPGYGEQRGLDLAGAPGSDEEPGPGSGRTGGRGGSGDRRASRCHVMGGGEGDQRVAVRPGAARTAAGREGGGIEALSRQERKQWSTATFQALVFDALMAGGLPPPRSTPAGEPPLSASPEPPAAAAIPAPPASPSPPPAPLVLTAEELEVLRWGRNASVSSVPRNVLVAVYKKATAVEVLVAHMYLTAPDRCAQLVQAAVAAPLLQLEQQKWE